MKRMLFYIALAVGLLILAQAGVAQTHDIYGRDLGQSRGLPELSPSGAPDPGGPQSPVATLSFQPWVAYPTGSWPEVVAIGDVSNDSRNDVVMGTTFYFSANDYKIFVFTQNEQGGLNTPVIYNGGNITCIDIGDLNHDFLQDVVMGFSDSIGIFYQNLSGTLNPKVCFYSGSGVKGLKVGDLNHDGLQDVAVGHTSAGYIRVFLQTAGGGFTSTTYASPGSGCGEVDAGDVTGDNLDDVVLFRSGYIDVFAQTSGGTLAAPVSYALTGTWGLEGIAIGDFNHDQRNDVVSTIYGNSPSSKVAVLLQNAQGTLQTPTYYPCYDCPEPVEAADMGGDGLTDVVTADGGWNAISIFEQNASGTLNSYVNFPVPYASHYKPQGLALGDINSDGKPDVALADYNHGLVVLINSTVFAPALDVTLTPVNPPIVIPANGGSFNFNASVQRTVVPQTSFSVWARIKNPDGSYTAPTLGPVTINPPVGQTVTRQRTQNVPGTWPAGTYTYLGYANTTLSYPAIDSSSFSFTKSATADGGAWVTDASCAGEPFPGEEIPSLSRGDRGDLVAVSPNPFNPTTALSYKLQAASQVSLQVYDTAGRLVTTLVDGQQEAGTHQVTFDGSKLASGLYFVRMQAGNFTAVQKLMLVK